MMATTGRDFEPVTGLAELTPGTSLRIVREFSDLSQNALAERCGVPQSTISSIESGRANLSVDLAKTLARALQCHPAVLMSADRTIERKSGRPRSEGEASGMSSPERSSGADLLEGTAGTDLTRFAGTLPAADAAEMLAAVDDDCRQIDHERW